MCAVRRRTPWWPGSSVSHSGVSIGDAVAGSSCDLEHRRPGRPGRRAPRRACACDVGARLARQRADVELEVDRVGDDVGLGRRRGRRSGRTSCGCRRGTGGPCPSGRASSASTKPVGVEQRRGDLVGQLHPLDEAAPDVVDLGSRAGSRRCAARPRPPSRARCRCGRAGTRGRACRATRSVHQCEPFSPTMHGQAHVAVGAGDRDAAGLGDDVVGADGVELVLGEVLGAPGARAPPRRPRPGRSACPSGRNPESASRCDGDGHRRGEVEHVDRAAAPDLAVDELAAERIAAPAVGVGRARRRCGPSAAASARRVACPRCGPRGWRGRARARSARGRDRSPSRYAAQHVDAARLAARTRRVPSFTQALRMRCCSRSVTSAVERRSIACGTVEAATSERVCVATDGVWLTAGLQ